MPQSSQKPTENKTVEDLAIELLTTGQRMTNGEQDARRLLAELRKEWVRKEPTVPVLHVVPSPAESGELYRDDVRDALAKAGWREDSRGQYVAENGAVWVETNDNLDSGIDAPDKSWTIAFDSSVPAVVIVAAALAAAGHPQAVTR